MAEANWTAIEDALHAWVVAGSKLAPQRVIWDRQNGTRPKRPFVTLHRDGGTTAGLLDEQRVRDADAPAPGAEITLETVAHSEFTLTVTAFTEDATGPDSALVLANRVRNSLSTESTLFALDEAGVAVIDRAPVLNLSDLLEVEIEGRAALDVRFRVGDGTEESATFIESASMSGAVD